MLLICRSSTEDDEAVLCTIKIASNGVLSVKPDFNKGRRAYKVGGGLNGRGMCVYLCVVINLIKFSLF